jgi:16S rRNA (guanine527-N7)-methyltransferase
MEAIIATLVLPILGAEELVSGRVLDVGAGNGSPGLVLAALRPDLTFVLLEPRSKRWAFLREAVREMGVNNVVVERHRSDSYSGAPVNTVTMRAVGLLPEEVRHLLVPSGKVLVFGGPPLSGAATIRLDHGSTVQSLCFT